ncbi:di-trans,poly-cis-decaprenylcistransferase [Candidatus Gottesmanbacteria bacterium CG11_big_fil_rev_8_21_14_0_20_37_11]|uniref:Isoprenyl transferase n=3 Tax=Candidatus Gottesmaniibacteriota TaxID=1752720 RepID=A0A2M7RRB5_9BACT|nr:MAG: di-trans,poly-cis-decaprenylcistransferase [Candidatus Gottesmanbacteria bacterium CG1_02_37_22]PIP32376.1 MAG: di-trans,poly-cis-decaprenylcistransferase [Candidatus Gottesmanbacteria bacterium CG23_combo_of_CG06-09_8_20_14_all_37_19]PIR07839.1 MAG: di-trans,poly-cis-decaprenylcistransferase [Candidatus Gottesmanbacteria bacterium CG11_big_fil_rev_8_21_14_0_20_37_11]PIZ02857.1 MAG: di-trans,poly-cis-decaprenylcistransferase [Candidatus Gottesmanbacteria bacterium CG_4_10_14_0_8_um_filte
MKQDLFLPKHVAIIMDGNRRWARKNRLPSFEGHRRGEEKIEPIIDMAIEMGIPFLTFWAFSTENWKRSKEEVSFLLNLYRNVLDKKIDKYHKKNVRINVIGNISMFPGDIQEKTQKWMEKTKNNKIITVNIALSYGGRDEIIRGVNNMLQRLTTQKEKIGKITADALKNYLDTKGQPDPDLLIRTGGEKRLSGFLLWQLEYAELYFTDVNWPDFYPSEFKKAIEEYQLRQRRFGK